MEKRKRKLVHNLRGQRFGGLVVVSYDRAVSKWRCACDCGNAYYANTGHLRAGACASCGCKKGNNSHGMSKTRIWSIFQGIKSRCGDKKQPAYKNYGGRGVRCEWESFEDFYIDMGAGYKDSLTIERIDNDGSYCKKNCRWATRREQANNSRHNNNITYNGKTQSVAEWARELDVNYWTLIRRIYRGWTSERALTT